MEAYKVKVDKIIKYLTTGCHEPTATKAEKKTIANNSKTHVWDKQSE